VLASSAGSVTRRELKVSSGTDEFGLWLKETRLSKSEMWRGGTLNCCSKFRVMNPWIWVSHYAGEGRLAVTSPSPRAVRTSIGTGPDSMARLQSSAFEALAIVFQPKDSLMELIYRGLMTSDWGIMIMNSKGKQTVNCKLNL
jgi:hypothetical protein